MEILIQGTKGGYRVLHKTTEFPSSFANDLRREDVENNRATVGSDFFSISFSNKGCIISKGICVWDEERRAIGNILFSIYIPNDKHLNGNELKALLDNLSDNYWAKYITTDGNINSNQQEEWSLFEDIANQYDNKLDIIKFDDIENYQLGNGEAAYIYYQDESKLIKYLDKPYQREYSAFKQVILVDKKFEASDKNKNPLNVIRHDSIANLTREIDLENLPFKLNYESKNGVKIDVYVNGKVAKINSNIKPNDVVGIIWSKPFCKTENTLKEKLKDLINNFDLDKTGNKITVKNKNLNPISYKFEFDLKYPTINIDKNAEINLYSKGQLLRKAENNILIITEEELQNKCFVKAQNGKTTSTEKEIRIGDEIKPIELALKEPKKVKFVIKDENGESITHNCTIHVKNKQSQPVNGEVTFEGDDIGKKWTITIKHNKYEDKVVPFFCPEDYKEPEHIQLKKMPNNNTGNLGNRQSFTEVNHGNGNKNNQSLLWIILVLAIVIIGSFIYYIESNDNRNKQSYADLTPNQIENYINGNDLSLRKLEQFKKTYCDKSNKDSEESLFEKLRHFISEENDNNNYKFCDEVKEAISIRNAVNLGDIDSLEIKKYSSNQKEFENAIKNISEKYKDKYKSQISDTLRRLSENELDLNKVAELINEVQKKLTDDSVNNETKTQIHDQSENIEPIKQPKEKKVNKPTENKQVKANKPANNKKVNKTFEQDFWKLVNKGNDVSQNEFAELYDKYKNNHTDKEIFKILKDLTNISKFEKFKNKYDEVVRKNANNMEDLKK